MFLYLSVPQQTLNVFDSEQDADPVCSFEVSTALNGIGSEKNSGKTPSGRLVVRAKIGQNMPVNTVFVARRPTGEIYSDALAQSAPERDWILTRILWLSGLELGKNRLGDVDTMQRYIYIHGTPDTEPMGVPKSHGCIRMRNQDVMALFDLIPVGTEMVIAT
ncbi:putative L,D-transpeptidase YbiS [Hydrogenovibrio crunogenus]|uniref:Putative L,D-transpeptidase YbiS n=1 Tax=Hydrogenovibrio crunogenus TaxID=39765 RepID=A0A4P7P0B6_9GAMM|nr:L,D-transpeptidase [Hydrogenovibrio crunogenus]QBZ83329.1 putative L,D-transpeptidase YbiS [Hydrogenovibrio crunogenus]